MHAATDDLARTRQAFELWRAKRRGRSRIPPELWEKAVSLLAHHPITHVARELRLDPAGLRRRRLASQPPLVPNSSPAPQFLEVRASDLSSRTEAHLSSDSGTQYPITDTAWRLQIERADGHRLTLHLPSSEWGRVEALCSLFLRA